MQYFGISVSGASLQSSLQSAFESGRAEERKSMDVMLNKVAAQVYDNVSDQLRLLQRKRVEEAEALAGELKRKIWQPAALQLSSCEAQRQRVLQCVARSDSSDDDTSKREGGKGVGSRCHDAMDAFRSCGMETLLNARKSIQYSA